MRYIYIYTYTYMMYTGPRTYRRKEFTLLVFLVFSHCRVRCSHFQGSSVSFPSLWSCAKCKDERPRCCFCLLSGLGFEPSADKLFLVQRVGNHSDIPDLDDGKNHRKLFYLSKVGIVSCRVFLQSLAISQQEQVGCTGDPSIARRWRRYQRWWSIEVRWPVGIDKSWRAFLAHCAASSRGATFGSANGERPKIATFK